MSHPMMMIHTVTAVTAQRLLYDTFTELKITIMDSDGMVSTVSLMSAEPVEIQTLPFRDVRKAEAVPA